MFRLFAQLIQRLIIYNEQGNRKQRALSQKIIYLTYCLSLAACKLHRCALHNDVKSHNDPVSNIHRFEPCTNSEAKLAHGLDG